VISVFTVLLSDGPSLSFGHCCEPNRQRIAVIFVVLCSDLFDNIACNYNMVVNKLSFQMVISNATEYRYKYWSLQQPLVEWMPLKFILSVKNCGVSLYLWLHLIRLRKDIIITPFIVICLNSYYRMFTNVRFSWVHDSKGHRSMTI
jgi:hypothetical protein